MSISPKSVVGVLVAYQPDEALHARLEAHLQQLEALIVVQNGAQSEPDAALKEFCEKHSAISFVSSADNNLAKAQNIGIKAAREQGAQAVLLLDDDSEMAPDMLSKLCEAYADGIGLVAPNLIERDSECSARYVSTVFGVGFRVQRLSSQQPVIENAFNLIASGSLIPMTTFEQVGLMDESFVIDYIDREYCLRLLTRGLKTVALHDAKLIHQIGQSDTHECMGTKVRCRHHPASRRYTIFKNRLHCWARYGLSMPSFLFYDLLATGYDVVRIVAFEEDKKAKLCAAARGMLAAVIGKGSHGND